MKVWCDCDLVGRGELVWARIPTIKPNPDQANTIGIDQIDYWPGIIVEAGVKVQPDEGGKDEILQSTRYEVRFCGHLDPEDTNRTRASTGMVDENDVLPWHFLAAKLPELAAIVQKYNLAIAEATISLKPGESAEEKRVETWRKGTTGRIWPIAEATRPENWEQIAVVYAQAVCFAMELSTVWCQTDGYQGQDDIATHSVAEQTTYFQVSASVGIVGLGKSLIDIACLCTRASGGVRNGFGGETWSDFREIERRCSVIA